MSDSAARIIRIATALFAEHGYDGVSTREIAAAAELNIATVHYHVGTKRELYREVFRRMSELEREVAGRIIAGVSDASLTSADAVRRLLHTVAAELVTMTRDHPQVPRLWVRRWLDEHDDAEVEVEASVPVYRMFLDLLVRIETESGYSYRGPNRELLLKSVAWILYGHALSGPLDWTTGRGNADDPQRLAELTDFLADYFARMFGLPEAAP
jgi:AcrR family transcriptional regulator